MIQSAMCTEISKEHGTHTIPGAIPSIPGIPSIPCRHCPSYRLCTMYHASHRECAMHLVKALHMEHGGGGTYFPPCAVWKPAAHDAFSFSFRACPVPRHDGKRGGLNVRYRTFRHSNNAKMEGFNNKIRWLIKQAYGFRDREYFKLKIYQLPEISSSKEI